jgi:hypothetical protein
MVHVEIFIGGETGEATIGARFFKGVVKEFDSYKFKSTTWDLVKYHFKSLDPWLEGKHESCCLEHPWHSWSLALAAAAGKRSIFNDVSEADESAGGMDEDITPRDYDEQGCAEDGANSESAGESSIPTMSALLVGTCLPCSPRDVLIQEQAKEIQFLRQELSDAKSALAAATTTDVKEHSSRPKCGGGSKSSGPLTPLSRSVESLPSAPIASESPDRQKSVTPLRGPRIRVAKSMELKKSIPLTYYTCKANGWKLWKVLQT